MFAKVLCGRKRTQRDSSTTILSFTFSFDSFFFHNHKSPFIKWSSKWYKLNTRKRHRPQWTNPADLLNPPQKGWAVVERRLTHWHSLIPPLQSRETESGPCSHFFLTAIFGIGLWSLHYSASRSTLGLCCPLPVSELAPRRGVLQLCLYI